MAFTLGELLARPKLEQPFIWTPFIPVGGCLLLGAESKTYKSFLTMNIAYDLARGVEPLSGGERVGDGIRVLYVELEVGENGVHNRFETIHAANGEDPIAACNLVIQTAAPGYKLFDAQLADLVKSTRPQLLILDPLRKFHTMDESSSTEVLRVLERITLLQRLADEGREDGGCASFIVHHKGKSSEHRDKSSLESIRGSSLLKDHPDAIIGLYKPAPDRKPNLLEVNYEVRHAESPTKHKITYDPYTAGFRKA